MFDFLTDKLARFASNIGLSSKISEESIKSSVAALQEILLHAEVPFKVTKIICDKIRLKLVDIDKKSSISLEERIKTILFNELLDLMGGKQEKIVGFPSLPLKSKILFAGLQGSGKTTTLAKLANHLLVTKQVKKILCTSVDFVRPAAVEQLKILAERAKIDFFDPIRDDISQTLLKAEEKFQSEQYDLFLIDTPGRLHVDDKLMKELVDINDLVRPTIKILVLDSMTGQNAFKVAKAFDDKINISGAILSKVDSDSKGGMVVAFYSELQKPVYFLGTGEHLSDIESFIPKRVVNRIMGGGDIESLVEKIEKRLTEEEKKDQSRLQQRFSEGKFTLQDFLSQMEMINSLGSLQKLMGYLPGFSSISTQQMQSVEIGIKNARAAILSMTLKERTEPKIINKSRIKRIAAGSGVLENDVVNLLQKFEQSKEFVKMMGKGRF